MHNWHKINMKMPNQIKSLWMKITRGFSLVIIFCNSIRMFSENKLFQRRFSHFFVTPYEVFSVFLCSVLPTRRKYNEMTVHSRMQKTCYSRFFVLFTKVTISESKERAFFELLADFIRGSHLLKLWIPSALSGNQCTTLQHHPVRAKWHIRWSKYCQWGTTWKSYSTYARKKMQEWDHREKKYLQGNHNA